MVEIFADYIWLEHISVSGITRDQLFCLVRGKGEPYAKYNRALEGYSLILMQSLGATAYAAVWLQVRSDCRYFIAVKQAGRVL